MDQATQYTVSLRELVEILIKKNGIHEGKWVPLIGMRLGAGQFGDPQQDESSPGAFVAFSNFGIQKVDPSSPPNPQAVVVDAALVNPRSTQTKKK